MQKITEINFRDSKNEFSIFCQLGRVQAIHFFQTQNEPVFQSLPIFTNCFLKRKRKKEKKRKKRRYLSIINLYHHITHSATLEGRKGGGGILDYNEREEKTERSGFRFGDDQ